MLRNWRVRSRLVLLIAIPTATALGLGGNSIVSSWQTALTYQRVERLAALCAQTTGLANALETERDETVDYLGLKQAGPGSAANAQIQLATVYQQRVFTTPFLRRVNAGLAEFGSSYPAMIAAEAAALHQELASLPSLRASAINNPNQPALDVVESYGNVIADLLRFDNQIALTNSDPQLAPTLKALTALSGIEQEYSAQQAIVVYALEVNQLSRGLLQALNVSLANQQADQTLFESYATLAQQQDYNTKTAASQIVPVENFRAKVLAFSSSLSKVGIVPDDWKGEMNNLISAVRSAEQDLVSQAVDRASTLRSSAINFALLIGGTVLLVLVLSLLFTVLVGRSMVRPLRRLRAGALEVAGIRLPETVRRMSESDVENIGIDVEPIDVDSADEIGEVARAFDQVHREALRLAANEAALRGNVNAMFVNLSRRSQSLVERQIRLIDELERGEQDPDRLSSLFQMDHLATRMRRNSENLLVLAGHDSARRWNQPVPLVDVLRAAISEIEQYERVVLNVQPGISVRGPAVNDVVHLIAELAENATSFSSADTPVSVSGHLLSSGGVLLDITDQGVGMGSEEMAHANWRLDNPPVVDVAVSRRMGLFVVARLAARHGIRIRLRSATGSGLTALVWLPDEVVVHDSTTRTGRAGLLAERSSLIALEPGEITWPGRLVRPGGLANGELGERDPLDRPSRSATEQEVAAARAPRFTPLSPEGGSLGPPRVPGAGPHPGQFTTGPIPAVMADQAGTAPFAPLEPPSLVAPAWAERADQQALDEEPAAASTGPIPVFGSGQADWRSSGEWFAPTSPLARSTDDQPGSEDWPTGPVVPANAKDTSQPADSSRLPGQPPADARPPLAVAWASEQPADSRPLHPVLGAPVAELRPVSGTFRTQNAPGGSAANEVIVPPAVSLREENRLPIFEAVESDWFRRGRPSVDWRDDGDDVDGVSEGDVPSIWASVVDDGWRAAEAAVMPTSGGVTLAGLPRRVPQANLIPGTASDAPTIPAPIRSPAATRERFASLQRGMREGRAASGIDTGAGTGDVPSDG
jgi:signal transduction histidine kinase